MREIVLCKVSVSSPHRYTKSGQAAISTGSQLCAGRNFNQ